MVSRKHVLITALILSTLLFATSCGSDGSTPAPTPNPMPAMISINPTTGVAGGAAFTLTVTGTGLISNSVVQWNGASKATTYVSATQLTAAITAADIATAGTATVTVSNPTPGGGVSAANNFTIQTPNPAPTITTLFPNNKTAGAAQFTLTVGGTGFINSSTVQWNGTARSTSYSSPTKISASITAADVATAGTAAVTVSNPAPGGGVSAANTFTINAPAPPVINNLSPSTAMVGGSAFTLTVSGSGFATGSAVRWAGAALATTFVGSTSLTAVVPAADISQLGNFDVTVENPDHQLSAASPFGVVAVTGGVFERVVTSTGAQGNFDSDTPSITPDGRFIVFQSYSNNMVPGDTNGMTDVFISDTCRGVSGACTPSMQLVSVATDGRLANGHSNSTAGNAVTPDGRFIVFRSAANNLVDGDTNTMIDLFLRDTCIGATGCTPSTQMVSVATDGTLPNNHSNHPAISANGRWVTFESYASNIGYEYDYAVYLRDTCINAPAGCIPSLQEMSKDEVEGLQPAYGVRPAITADGAYIAYENYHGVNMINTCAGVTAGCTQHNVVFKDQNNDPISGNNISMSADGRVMAFIKRVMVGGNPRDKVMMYDTCIGAGAGCTAGYSAISDAIDGTVADGDLVNSPSVSATGRYVAFTSYATNLVAGDTNNVGDLYVYDSCMGATGACAPSMRRASLAYDGSQPNMSIFMTNYGITGDGKIVVFSSRATNLVPFDTNSTVDVFTAYTSY